MEETMMIKQIEIIIYSSEDDEISISVSEIVNDFENDSYDEFIEYNDLADSLSAKSMKTVGTRKKL